MSEISIAPEQEREQNLVYNINVKELSVLDDRKDLERIESDLRERAELTYEQKTDLIGNYLNIVPASVREGFRSVDIENGKIFGSERYNQIYTDLIQKIRKETGYFDYMDESGVTNWIMEGRPEKKQLPNGYMLVHIDKDFLGGGSWEEPGKISWSVHGRIRMNPRSILFRSDVEETNLSNIENILKGSNLVTAATIQHELAHAASFWEKHKFRGIFKDVYSPGIELTEAFAWRSGHDQIELTESEELVDMLMNLKTHEKYIPPKQVEEYEKTAEPGYKFDEEKLRYSVGVVDKLYALNSIHPNRKERGVFRAVGSALSGVAKSRLESTDSRSGWDEESGTYPVLEQELDKLCEELGVEKDKLDELVENYKIVRSIQRLAAQVIVKEKLEDVVKLKQEGN